MPHSNASPAPYSQAAPTLPSPGSSKTRSRGTGGFLGEFPQPGAAGGDLQWCRLGGRPALRYSHAGHWLGPFLAQAQPAAPGTQQSCITSRPPSVSAFALFYFLHSDFCIFCIFRAEKAEKGGRKREFEFRQEGSRRDRPSCTHMHTHTCAHAQWRQECFSYPHLWKNKAADVGT